MARHVLNGRMLQLVNDTRSRFAQPRSKYLVAQSCFEDLVGRDDLDAWRSRFPCPTLPFDSMIDEALIAAYQRDDRAAHLLLQRVLYGINRLTLFWYDELRNYENERSPYLRALAARIEARWQAWELARTDAEALREEPVSQGLRDRTDADVDPVPSAPGRYFRYRATLAGYRRLLEVGSLDALVEASQLSRTLGGASNRIHATLTRLLVEEYGGGRLEKKHSSHFRVMLEALGMRTTPEAYLARVPWEVLALINHSFLLSDRKRFFLRYVGGLLHTETSVPAAFGCYRDAAVRLGLAPEAMAYWDLHIKEDARHGPWMLLDVALPLLQLYPRDGWEMLLGYDQQARMSARAGEAVAREAALADGAPA